jgi:hypothetical protein
VESRAPVLPYPFQHDRDERSRADWPSWPTDASRARVGIHVREANSPRMAAADAAASRFRVAASRRSAEVPGRGVVIPLRDRQMTDTMAAEPRTTSPELGPVTPELVLIDPELARAARALLPDLPRAIPTQSVVANSRDADQFAFVEVLRSSVEPAGAEKALQPRAGLGRVAVAGVVGLALLAAVLVRSEWRSTPRQESTFTAAPPARSPVPPASARTDPASTPAVPGQTTPAPTPSTPTTPPVPAPSSPASDPPAPPATTSEPAAPVPPGQTFVWAAAPGSAAYEFQLFRGNARIFRARALEPRLELPGRWRQGGRTQTLTPGTYRWYVWPISSRTKQQSDVAIVQARLVIEETP